MVAREAGGPPGEAWDAALLLRVIRDFAAQAVPAAAGGHIGLDSRMSGLDSLTLAELRSRVEEAFGVTLPDDVLSGETADDWLAAVRAARGEARPPTVAAGPMPLLVPPPADVQPATAAETLPKALAWHARAYPARACITALEFAGAEPAAREITYGGLDQGSRAVAAGLRQRGLAPGDRVAIMLPTGAGFFTSFMGTLMAGGVAVPIYPPSSPAGLEEHLNRQAVLLGNASPAVLVTVPEASLVARLLRARVPSLRSVTSEAALRAGAEGDGPALPTAATTDVALLQYTSGSTGDPKGVMLTHGHLLANIRAMSEAACAGPTDVFVSWLPLYHDMGLIGAWLAGLCFGFPLVVMSPLAFMSRPARWLRAISDYHGTLSAAPNFGYELCARQVPGQDLADLDLSSWRLAFDGSETVSPGTIRRFTGRFEAFGLRPEVLAPAYGLAEAGVGVTFPPLGRGPAIDAIDRGVLARTGRAVPASPGHRAPLEVVSCGRPLPGYQLRVVDSAGRELGERCEGRVEFTGPSATPGYYRNEAATAALRHGPWTVTGDLGYLTGGELYLTGRAKDIIIRRGRNLHPDDVEEAVSQLTGAEPGGVAVFGCSDPDLGTERLVVAAETRQQDPAARTELRARITALSAGLLGVAPDEVVLAAPGTVPKTTSGKARRAEARDRYQAGTLGQPGRGARWQVARFALSGIRPGLRRAARSGAALLYAAYAWAVTVLVGAPAWLLVAALPGLRARWAVLRRASRLLRRALAVPLTVSGQLPAGSQFVAVANHASFIDGLVLVLCLPGPVCFAAAGAFSAQRIAGPFLRRIGCEFVNPARPQEAAAATRRMAAALAAGRSLTVWPEGSLSHAPGVRHFYLGAFEAAAAAGATIVPIGIRGTRGVLRPGSRFPRRAAVRVSIGNPIAPAGSGWAATVALRDQARAAVLALSGEPDVG